MPIHRTEHDEMMVMQWGRLLRQECMEDIRELEDMYPDMRSLYIEFGTVDDFDADMALSLLDNPRECIQAARDALRDIMRGDMADADIDIRITNLPRDAHIDIRDLRGRHLGKLISFDALVTKAVQVRNDIRIAAFQCARCGAIIRHVMEDQLYSEPLECYREQDGCGRSGGTTRFRLIPELTKTEDVQKIECQEPLDGAGATPPARISVWLTGELAGSVTAGNRIILNGIPRMITSQRSKSTVMDTDVMAVSLEIQGQDFDELEITDEDRERFEADARDPDLYQHMIASISPSIKGREMEKAGLLLQLFGGVPKTLDDGTRLRGDIHILLVGDPGTAKSAMVYYSSMLAPRGVFASGKSTSAAGLTATATKDGEFGEGRWTLEAGAMVLADMGMLCVDEIDKMSEGDRSALHEGMEQQRISINKAGISATLSTRCSILAAANPKHGRFIPHEPLAAQIDLPDTLLSRFDLIFSIRDIPNKKNDADISSHILAAHTRGGALANPGDADMREILEQTDEIKPYFPIDYIRKYVAYAKRIRPVLSAEAAAVIRDHYVNIRRLGDGEDQPVPITARQLEGYVRLAEASARMRLSKWVEVEDAIRAIDLIEYYLSEMTGDGNIRDIDMVMTSMPKSQRDQVALILDIIRSAGSVGLTMDEVIEMAHSRGNMSESRTRAVLNRLKRQGDIMEPRFEILKIVE